MKNINEILYDISEILKKDKDASIYAQMDEIQDLLIQMKNNSAELKDAHIKIASSHIPQLLLNIPWNPKFKITRECLALYDNAVLSLKDPELSLEYAMRHFGTASPMKGSLKNHENIILKAKNPELCFKFVKRFHYANMSQHEEIILNAKNPSLCYEFFAMIMHENITANTMMQYFYDSKKGTQVKPTEMCGHLECMLQVRSAEIWKHLECIYNSGDKKWIDKVNNFWQDGYKENKRLEEEYDFYFH